jgi:hypothetical protein
MPKDKVTFLKSSSMNLVAMIVAQGLLVACSSHSCPETIFLKEHGIIMPELLLLYLVIGKYSS